MPNSWKTEVLVQREWTGNKLRFATKVEGDGYVQNLFMRWTLVEDTRTVESDDAVNSQWIPGQGLIQGIKPVEAAPAAETAKAS